MYLWGLINEQKKAMRVLRGKKAILSEQFNAVTCDSCFPFRFFFRQNLFSLNSLYRQRATACRITDAHTRNDTAVDDHIPYTRHATIH